MCTCSMRCEYDGGVCEGPHVHDCRLATQDHQPFCCLWHPCVSSDLTSGGLWVNVYMCVCAVVCVCGSVGVFLCCVWFRRDQTLDCTLHPNMACQGSNRHHNIQTIWHICCYRIDRQTHIYTHTHTHDSKTKILFFMTYVLMQATICNLWNIWLWIKNMRDDFKYRLFMALMLTVTAVICLVNMYLSLFKGGLHQFCTSKSVHRCWGVHIWENICMKLIVSSDRLPQVMSFEAMSVLKTTGLEMCRVRKK